MYAFNYISTKAVVCGMVHIKEPLLLIGKSSPCSDSSGFPLTEWSFTIRLFCHITINEMSSASLNKTFPSFQHSVICVFIYFVVCIDYCQLSIL